MGKEAETVDTVRESYALVNKGKTLFNSLTHTLCLPNK